MCVLASACLDEVVRVNGISVHRTALRMCVCAYTVPPSVTFRSGRRRVRMVIRRNVGFGLRENWGNVGFGLREGWGNVGGVLLSLSLLI